MKVVLNKAAGQWCDFEGVAYDRFPVVVRRVPSTVRHIKDKAVKTLNRVIEERTDCMEGASGRCQKRIKLR